MKSGHRNDVTGRKTEFGEKERSRSTGVVCPPVARTSAETTKDFTIEGLRRRCAPKHRKNHRETVGWYRKIARGVCSLLKWHRPGVHDTPGLLISAVVI